MANPALPGLLPGKVFLIDPRPEWPALYELEADRIRNRLGGRVVAETVTGMYGRPSGG